MVLTVFGGAFNKGQGSDIFCFVVLSSMKTYTTKCALEDTIHRDRRLVLAQGLL